MLFYIWQDLGVIMRKPPQPVSVVSSEFWRCILCCRKDIEERTRLYREALDLAEKNAGKKGKKGGGNRPQTR